jgi:hypothetical protein
MVRGWGAGGTLVAAMSLAMAAPAAAQRVLQPADITLKGFYDVRLNGENSTHGQGLTHRHVDGQLRLLTLALGGRLDEFAVPAAFGETVTVPLRSWNLGPARVLNDMNGIWFEEAKNRLWVTSAKDYTAEEQPVRISTLTLGPNGEVTRVRTIGLRGLNGKRVYGGVQPVPEWAQKALRCGPYVVGFGGYTSLLAQGGGASIGPTAYCIPDPDTVPDGTQLKSSAYRVLLDAAGDRGVRKTIPDNYFDGGDPRPNPATRPTRPPDRGADWLSPNRQGLGWFVWGDSYYNTGMWIDTPEARGFLLIASLCQGACWYQSSTLAFDGRQFELHIWDPARLGKGKLTRPDSMMELDLPRGNTRVWEGNVTAGNISGATFDAATHTIYAIGCPLGPDFFTCRLYAFDAAIGARADAPPPAGGPRQARVVVAGPRRPPVE